MVAPSCLGGLYNSTSEARAHTAKANIGDASREQEICSPEKLLAAVRKTWGKIALDPCHSPKSLVGAERVYHIPERTRPAPRLKSGVEAYYEADASLGEVNGLIAPWCDFTYVNPPYRLLEDWLGKAESEGREHEVILLCPVRPNRVWFRRAMRSARASGGGILWLDPLAFMGNLSAFPQALCVLYWGSLLSNFELAFQGLGELD